MFSLLSACVFNAVVLYVTELGVIGSGDQGKGQDGREEGRGSVLKPGKSSLERSYIPSRLC